MNNLHACTEFTWNANKNRSNDGSIHDNNNNYNNNKNTIPGPEI